MATLTRLSAAITLPALFLCILGGCDIGFVSAACVVEGECFGGEGLSAPPPFASVAAGWAHTCGVDREGSVRCWGGDIEGKHLGTPAAEDVRWGALDVRAPRFSGVSAGWVHTCGLEESGRIECWGETYSPLVPDPAGSFVSVDTASSSASCAINASGALHCWGDPGSALLREPEGTYTQVSAERAYACAVNSASGIDCWGSSPVAPPNDLGEVSAVTCGERHACALLSDRRVRCWGADDLGQLGAPPGEFTKVDAGTNHTCALSTSGAISCWGENDRGQIDVAAASYVDVASGARHSCGVTASGDVHCWGNNDFGQSESVFGSNPE